MNPLDIGVVAVIVLSAIFAFARGFVREALSIVAWVGAAFITLRGFGAAFTVIDPLVKNPLLSQLIAGFGLFVISLVILTIITSIIARYVRTSSLSAIDRTLGFVFGIARGLLIVSLAYLLLDAAVAKDDRPIWVQQAKSTPFLHWGADELKVFLPEQLKFRNASVTDEIIKAVDPKALGEDLAKKAAGALINPTPAQAAKDQPAQNPAYRPVEQRKLNQLFDNQSR
jgi:membrane protein required for colicin V production